jgi:HK97 family phage prohead protease
MEATRNKNVGLRSLYSGSIRAIGDENSRQFEISFSSEEPYDRWFGPEILDHASGCCDLSRLQEIGVVLYNHNRDDVIGKITRAWIDAGRGCATIELDDDEDSERICKKVRSGTLKGISVGYQVTNWESVEAGKKSLDGRFTGPCEVAKRWMPYEVSIVSIPADATVGVGREFEQTEQTAAIPAQEEGRSSKPALSIYESIITTNRNF